MARRDPEIRNLAKAIDAEWLDGLGDDLRGRLSETDRKLMLTLAEDGAIYAIRASAAGMSGRVSPELERMGRDLHAQLGDLNVMAQADVRAAFWGVVARGFRRMRGVAEKAVFPLLLSV